MLKNQGENKEKPLLAGLLQVAGRRGRYGNDIRETDMLLYAEAGRLTETARALAKNPGVS